MTIITLPRATVEQALEALKYHVEQTRPIHRTNEAIDALRAALEKTVQEPVAMKTHGAWDGLELLDGLPDGACLYTAPPQQAEPVEPVLQTCNCRWDGEVQVQQCTLHEAHVDAIHEWAERAKVAERKLAQQAEPVEPAAWLYTGIKQDGTEHGPHLVWKPEYMDAMSASKGAKATPLYFAPPQRKPLTKEEMRDLVTNWFAEDWAIEKALGLLSDYDVERAHGIGRQTDPQIADRLARHGIPKP